MSPGWDIWSEAGNEMRFEFWVKGLKYLGCTFEKKDLEKSTDCETDLQSKP